MAAVRIAAEEQLFHTWQSKPGFATPGSDSQLPHKYLLWCHKCDCDNMQGKNEVELQQWTNLFS